MHRLEGSSLKRPVIGRHRTVNSGSLRGRNTLNGFQPELRDLSVTLNSKPKVYRYVRNPMYLALASMVLGQALILGSRRLVLYVAVMALPVYAFVRFHEEPILERRFGEPYERYCANVPRWLPRLHPGDGA
jgi:hypothetical protein